MNDVKKRRGTEVDRGDQKFSKRKRFDHIFRLAILGDEGNMKLLKALSKGPKLQDSGSETNFIASFFKKVVIVRKQRVKLEIWVISEEEKYLHLAEMFCSVRRIDCLLLCYKWDNLESLNKCGKLNKLAVGICNENEVSCDDVSKYLVSISSSLEKENGDENEDVEVEGAMAADHLNAKFINLDLDLNKCESLFQQLSEDLIDKKSPNLHDELSQEEAPPNGIVVEVQETTRGKFFSKNNSFLKILKR